jgi:hypothetical protein
MHCPRRTLDLHVDHGHLPQQDFDLRRFLCSFPSLRRIYLHWFRQEWFEAGLFWPADAMSRWNNLNLDVDAHRPGFGVPEALAPFRQLLRMDRIGQMTISMKPSPAVSDSESAWYQLGCALASLRDLNFHTLGLKFRIDSTSACDDLWVSVRYSVTLFDTLTLYLLTSCSELHLRLPGISHKW